MLIASSNNIVIVGLGVTGLSVARYLRKRDQLFRVMDSRQKPAGLAEFAAEFPDVDIHLGDLDQEVLLSATQIIVSPGVSLKTPEILAAIKVNIEVIGDVELFARELHQQQNPAPIIAITGSNGKTTVTTLVGQMAEDDGKKCAIGGNIGTPVLDLLDESIDIYVLELSSFQLETTMSLKPEIATVLNISHDHMDRYESLMGYCRAKQRIYFGARTIVINRADPLTQPPLAEHVSCLSFGLDEPDRNAFGIRIKAGRAMIAHEFVGLMPADKLLIQGQHNIANGIAALAMGYAAKFSINSMMKTLQNFKGLPHRCQWVATVNNVDYINDSKATNIGATVAALNGFSADNNEASSDKNIVLIAGGEGKGVDFTQLRQVVSAVVSLLITIGKDAPLINAALGDCVDTRSAETLDEAVVIAQQAASSGDVVLLSPACASFDMFSGYEDRGNQFIQAVKGLVA